jgi:hypothetical protein
MCGEAKTFCEVDRGIVLSNMDGNMIYEVVLHHLRRFTI